MEHCMLLSKISGERGNIQRGQTTKKWVDLKRRRVLGDFRAYNRVGSEELLCMHNNIFTINFMNNSKFTPQK